LSFCGVVGLGAYQARATDVTEPELVTSFYGSVGARVMAGLAISEMFSLRIFAELAVPFVRPSLVVDDQEVWSAPPVYGTFGLAGAAHFL
jgi:hypothetical protein